MSGWEIFKKAPIVEALLDITVSPPPLINLEQLEQMDDLVAPSFDQRKKPIRMMEGSITINGDNQKVGTSSKTLGYRYQSTTEKKLLQIRLNGFTYNKLEPYTCWKEFKSEALDYWNKYIGLTHPLLISRIGLRYINRIVLPVGEIGDYFSTRPEIAPNLPQALSHFFMRLVIPKPNTDIAGIITQTIEDPEGDVIPFLFDIDVVCKKDINLECFDENILNEMRIFKNELFFYSLSDKVKELWR